MIQAALHQDFTICSLQLMRLFLKRVLEGKHEDFRGDEGKEGEESVAYTREVRCLAFLLIYIIYIIYR